MSSGGKSGSSQQSLNYYGTIAGAICWGPLDWLTAIVLNGNYVWQCGGGGPLSLAGVTTADGYVDLTGGLLDPTLIMEGGYFHLYPGTSTANPDPALPGHPGYRDTCYIVAQHIFFGQNSGTAPNIQIIGGRVPRVPTTIVAAIDNVADDRQVNPVAALAEILLDERGGSLTESQLDAPSWLAAAHWCAQDAAHRAYAFVSPLFTEQTAVRDMVKVLLDPINGYIRWTSAGKLGCYIYEWGTNPGGLITVDARHWTQKKPKFSDGDWQAIPTELVVSFTDRGYEFQENSVRIPNQRAAQIRGLDDPQKLDRKNVTRSAQAQANGVEYMRRIGNAPGTGTIYVRGPIVAGVQPGDKLFVDTDPEPGGAGLAQLARVDKIEIDRTDEVTIDLTVDPLLPATAYTPAWVSPLPESLFAGAVESAPSLVHLLAIPLPLDYFGWPPQVGFLATRPSAEIAGFHAYFTTNPATPFAELGVQDGFAARCQLVNAIGTGAGTIRLQLLDGASGPDAYIAAQTPGGNVAQAKANDLLAILVALDGSGRVALDGSGQPIMEFASILQRSAVTSDTHDYTVYRGVAATSALAWGAGAAAWIIPLANLVGFQHDLFNGMFGQVGYFRLASFTSSAVDESNPLPETDMVWPSIPTPNSLVATAGTGKEISLNWLGSSVFSSTGEYAVFRATGAAFTDWAKIGEIRATRFTDHEVALGTTYEYKIAAVTENELTSAYSNTVTITVPSVLSSDVDSTKPTDATAATLVGSGTYVAADGTVHSYLMIRVPILPGATTGKVAATEQEILYRIDGTGSTAWTIQDQPQNTSGTVDIRIDDLPPGSSIDVVSRTYSRFGIPAANDIAATGSPFTAPVKTSNPTTPTTGSLAPDTTSPAVKSDLSGILFGCRVSVTAPNDKDIVAIVAKVTFTDSDSAIDYSWGDYAGGSLLITRTITPGQSVSFTVYNPLVSPGFVRIASVDSSGNQSAGWLRLGNANANCTVALGNMSVQSSSNVSVSGVKTGASTAGSVRQVLARDPFDIVPTLVGGSTEEAVNVDLTGRGFNTKPDETTGAINVSSDPALKCRYDWDDAGNSSTNAVLKVSRYDGTALGGGAVRLQGEFVEHF